jgi:hypothetical protein
MLNRILILTSLIDWNFMPKCCTIQRRDLAVHCALDLVTPLGKPDLLAKRRSNFIDMSVCTL